MTDEHDPRLSENRRSKSRRNSDIAMKLDMGHVRSELKAMRKRQYDLDNEVHALAFKHDRLETQLTGAKGAVLGMGLVISGFVYLLGDRLKELLFR